MAGLSQSWEDLGRSYLLRFRISSPEDTVESTWLFNMGSKSLKAALKIDPSLAGAWNSLGVLTFFKDPKLSQHAFIQSLHLNSKVLN